MAQTFNRCFGPPSSLRGGEFTRNTESGRACLCCPLCGARYELPPGFAPDLTGRVNYALTCRGTPPCPWFDWAILSDHWLEEA